MYKENYFKDINREIVNLIENESQILDLGCGNGELLTILKQKKRVKGLGIDINEQQVLSCLSKGISVIHEDIDAGLVNYRDMAYDYVILSQTLQVVRRPDFVLQQIVRIGRKAVVSFPNFGYYKIRFALLLRGHMPKSKVLPFEWYNTPNIHLLTIKDFYTFCRKNKIQILKKLFFRNNKKKSCFIFGLENLFAEEVIFLIKKKS